MTVCSFRNAAGPAAFAGGPAGFPMCDRFYVFVTPARNSKDVVTGGFFHLCQKLQTKYRNFAFLLQWPAAVVIAVTGSLVVQRASLAGLFAVILPCR